MKGAPFAGARQVTVVLPPASAHRGDDRRRIDDLPVLFDTARAALERELGAPFVLTHDDPGTGARWLLRVGGTGAPTLDLDRRAGRLVTDGPDVDGAFETFSYLRTLWSRDDGLLVVRDAPSYAAAADALAAEVAATWPSFAARTDLDWAALCRVHRPRVVAARDDETAVEALQAWLASLGDAHTRLRPVAPPCRLPYVVHLTPERALLHEVPADSNGWRAGARPGMPLRVPPPTLERVWRTTGAPPRMRPWTAGQRLLEGPPGEVELRAGPSVRWTETRRAGRAPRLEVHRSGPTVTVRFDAFVPHIEAALHEAVDDAFAADVLVVDLRNNGGGHVGMARRLQQRFLREPTGLGTARTSLPGGGLGPEDELWGEPQRPFPGRLRVLTSARTYSAAEDFLLGLQGLSHVEVVGQPSGGGSGRVRTLRSLPGWRLAISTTLTWDRQRRLVEGHGIPVDRRLAYVPGRP